MLQRYKHKYVNVGCQFIVFSLQVEWRGLGRISGVRAVHAEVVSGAPPFCVGDKVRVRAAVTQPRYKWGCIDHSSVGTVKGKRCCTVYILRKVHFYLKTC